MPRPQVEPPGNCDLPEVSSLEGVQNPSHALGCTRLHSALRTTDEALVEDAGLAAPSTSAR